MDRDMLDCGEEDGSVSSRATTEALIERLCRKRAEIERQIDEFRQSKEQEYQDYQVALRKEAQEAQSQAQCTGDDLLASALQALLDGEQMARSPLSTHSRSESVSPSSVAGAIAGARNDAHQYELLPRPRSPSTLSNVSNVSNLSSSITEARRSSNLTSNVSETASASSASSLTLSSSATEHHITPKYPFTQSSSSAIDSVLEQHSLSASAPPHEDFHPRQQYHHRHSDSFNSTTSSSSLRSSIKDPKQPKSPKRVLFSLGEGQDLVSPSSSPRRGRNATSSASSTPYSRSPGSGGRMKRSHVKDRRFQRTSLSRDNSHRDIMHSNEPQSHDSSPASSSFFSGWAKNFPIMAAKPAHEISSPFRAIVPTNLNDAAENTTAPDDFERVEKSDGDDLFAFDEDLKDIAALSLRDKQAGQSDPGDQGDEMLTEDQNKNEDAAELQNGTSPHAGSLPIEIKWPERRQVGVGVM